MAFGSLPSGCDMPPQTQHWNGNAHFISDMYYFWQQDNHSFLSFLAFIVEPTISHGKLAHI
eukprot:6690699-Ditylum_brightwellii.AAC.1